MAPGPKKKNFKKESHETPRDKKNVKVNVETNKSFAAKEKYVESAEGEFQKSGKTSLNSNWDRYEEPKLDPFADKMRGDDFDVLRSYSGGSSSHMQLQDEKYWDEGLTDENNLVLDFEDLEAAIKCIPFHKLIALSEDIFDESQITNFTSCAVKGLLAYKNRTFPAAKKMVQEFPKTEADMNILENTEDSESEETPSKNYGLEENTENIIESLTSSLSLKSWAKEDSNAASEENVENPPSQSDDLDFLLSLSIPSKSVTSETKNENKAIEVPKTTSVDDWLNSILDD